MSEIKDKLRELLAGKGVMTGAEWWSKANELEYRRQAGDYEIANVVPGEIVGDEDNAFYLVRTEMPLTARQGVVELGAALEAMPEHIALSACDPDLEDFDPAHACFVDTETTGLVGGTGTMTFLVGVGYFQENAFRLEQCFMRDFDDEEPMLEHLGRLLSRFRTVVSYNGKSFDVPLLRTRFVTHRMQFPLDAARHFDLVHAARRFWKTRVQDCSLGSIERAVLGVRRQGDVPSEEIPGIWMDYLRTRDARELERVFYHHKMDVLSLVSLTAVLSQWLDVPDGNGFEYAEDRLALVRLHFRQKRFEDAANCARRLLEGDLSAPMRRECMSLMAFSRKRLNDWQAMEEAWDLLTREFPDDLSGRLELAKHHEHRTRNLEEAERICRETLALIETRMTLGGDTDLKSFYAQNFRYRLDRIQRKRSRRFEMPEQRSAP